MSTDRVRLIIGCGYVGRRVAQKWIERGDTVFALTRSAEHANQLHELGVQSVIGDVTDAATLVALPAAETVLYAVGFDRKSGHAMRDVYVGGLRNVLDRVAKTARKFVYVSSTSVYGQQAGERVDETSPCEPATENGRICREAEELVRQVLPKGDGFGERGAVILRLAGIYGPGRLIARMEALKRGDPLPGNPDAWLNLIHVDDAVTTVLAAADRGRSGDTYLVCDDEPPMRRDYYAQLAKLVGVPVPPMTPESTSSDASPAALNKRCSNRKLRAELCVNLLFPTIATGLPQAVGNAASAGPRSPTTPA